MARTPLSYAEIAAAMEQANGVRTEAARLLGVGPSTLTARGKHTPDIRQLFDDWKLDPRRLAAESESKVARAHTIPELDRPLDWWETVIAYEPGLRQILACMVLTAYEDALVGMGDALVFFRSPYFRDVMRRLGIWPVVLPPELRGQL